MANAFLFDGPDTASFTILLAHGAGAPMDSAAMSGLAQSLADGGMHVARFEFDYMAVRRSTGRRAPPPKAETLLDEYRAAVAGLAGQTPLVIGGKSMGGRIASMVADELHAAGTIIGLLCLGYPFHPPGKPEQPRTKHLEALATPSLICQGTRDPFGTPEDVAGYRLSQQIEILWLEDGDHDFKPRKRLSGLSLADHQRTIGKAARKWIRSLPV
jgi:predicted alpha/beta-hydrolase family hydrolase